MSDLGDFGHWLAGFIDGEGCFQIDSPAQQSRKSQQSFAYRCRFTISLRYDDEAILREAQERTGIGVLSSWRSPNPNAHGQTRWTVGSKVECMTLVAILDRHPLRAKKAQDYAVWRAAVIAWQSMGRNRANDWTRIAELKERLDVLRRPPERIAL